MMKRNCRRGILGHAALALTLTLASGGATMAQTEPVPPGSASTRLQANEPERAQLERRFESSEVARAARPSPLQRSDLGELPGCLPEQRESVDVLPPPDQELARAIQDLGEVLRARREFEQLLEAASAEVRPSALTACTRARAPSASFGHRCPTRCASGSTSSGRCGPTWWRPACPVTSRGPRGWPAVGAASPPASPTSIAQRTHVSRRIALVG